MAKSKRVETPIEEVFEDDVEFSSDLKHIRDSTHDAARFMKRLRNAVHLTQHELAQRLGISQPRICAMERGIGPEGPTYAMLKRVAAACGAQWSLEGGLNSVLPARSRGKSGSSRTKRAGVSEHDILRDTATLKIGPYTFEPSAKVVIDASGGRKVRLTEKEVAILKYLYRAGDRGITRDTLLGRVWGSSAPVTRHTLETHISRLRRKIERDPANAEILITGPKGYRLLS
jgi:DNA-binding winged helix-turn-helix (wHTH) protein/DNA-binding XRE family transcriptional regulator